MVRRDGSRIVRCFTRNGNDWTDRFPAIVETASQLRATSFLIDGEAVIAHDDGTPDFHALRNRRRGGEVVLHAFDLLELVAGQVQGFLAIGQEARPRHPNTTRRSLRWPRRSVG